MMKKYLALTCGVLLFLGVSCKPYRWIGWDGHIEHHRKREPDRRQLIQ